MKRLIIIVITVLISGCEGISYYSDPVEKSNIPGTYYPNFVDRESDYIELKADGTYRHFYRDDADSLISDSGIWEFYTGGYENFPEYSIYFPTFVRRHLQVGGCYSQRGEAAIDTTPTKIMLSFYRVGDRYVIEYCALHAQTYAKVDSSTGSD